MWGRDLRSIFRGITSSGRAETATIGTVVSRLDQRGFFTYADPNLLRLFVEFVAERFCASAPRKIRFLPPNWDGRRSRWIRR